MYNTISIILISIIALAVIIALVWKNIKDKRLLNPDSQDSVGVYQPPTYWTDY
jgi:hypothetical protein